MTTYGSIEAFTGKSEDFDVYVERLEQYLEANDLGELKLKPDGSNKTEVDTRNIKRRAILLSVIGSKTYGLLRNLVSPARPADETFEGLVKILREHFNPTASVTVQRFKFHTRSRQPGESVGDFISELRKLAEDCNFGPTLDDMLRDRLLCGINNDIIQKRLLIEKDLTYAKAYSIATAQELAQKNIAVLQGANPQSTTATSTVNKVTVSKPAASGSSGATGGGRYTKFSAANKGTPQRNRDTTGTPTHSEKKCYRCGGTTHLANKCKHIGVTCHYCHKKGHLAKVCLRRKHFGSTKVNFVDSTPEEETPEFTEYGDGLYHIHTKCEDPPMYVDTFLDDNSVKFQIDTGAGPSVINHDTYKELFGDLPLKPTNLGLGSYSGHAINVLGVRDVSVRIGEEEQTLPIYVVQGNGPPLLGRNWLRNIKLPWKTIMEANQINQVSSTSNSNLTSLLSEHNALFKDEPGLLKNFEASF